MSSRRNLDSLDRVADLREREVDRLNGELAEKRAMQTRFVRNISRLEQLADGTGATGSPAFAAAGTPLSPALSLNCGGYKQSVLQMAASHRVDLGLHEADMALAQRSLTEANRRHEALNLILKRERARVRQEQARREQRRQDDVASEVWSRGRK